MRPTSCGAMLALSSVLLFGCGDNFVGALPDSGASDLADAGGEPTGYPPGPYGVQQGDVILPMTFAGYFNASPDEGPVTEGGYVEDISFQMVRELEQNYRFMLLNIAAEWCAPCREEAQALPARFTAWAPRGGFVLSVITEDTSSNPSTKNTLDTWLRRYPGNYTMVHDPQQLIATKVAPTAMPTNFIIDLTTMKIVRRNVGDDPSFFDFFDAQLEP